MEDTKEVESSDTHQLEAENDQLRESVAKLKSHYTKMLDFAKKNNLRLRRRNVPGMTASAMSSSMSPETTPSGEAQ